MEGLQRLYHTRNLSMLEMEDGVVSGAEDREERRSIDPRRYYPNPFIRGGSESSGASRAGGGASSASGATAYFVEDRPRRLPDVEDRRERLRREGRGAVRSEPARRSRAVAIAAAAVLCISAASVDRAAGVRSRRNKGRKLLRADPKTVALRGPRSVQPVVADFGDDDDLEGDFEGAGDLMGEFDLLDASELPDEVVRDAVQDGDGVDDGQDDDDAVDMTGSRGQDKWVPSSISSNALPRELPSDYPELHIPEWFLQEESSYADQMEGIMAHTLAWANEVRPTNKMMVTDDGTFVPAGTVGSLSPEGHFMVPEYESADSMNADQMNSNPIPPHALTDILQATTLFKNTVAITIYEPELDEFLLLVGKDMRIANTGFPKLANAWESFVYMLRQTFPDRFAGRGSDEFAVALVSGDYPHMSRPCLDSFPYTSERCLGTHVPILNFGSVFRKAAIFPNMLPMPMPVREHIHCFKDWVKHEGGEVCAEFQPGSKGWKIPGTWKGGLVFGEEYGLEWEKLVPQVVWRGSDFDYLTTLTKNYLRRAWFVEDIERKVGAEYHDRPIEEKKRAATAALRESYDKLWPRWKAFVHSMEAEIEAEERGTLPWANIRFSRPPPKMPEVERKNYDGFKDYGLDPIDGYVGSEEQARYKYQLDLGGGGGTTWGGTFAKLAMPGLLFHHVTMTYDYFHEFVKPWVHYVPVSPDLSDLREKVEWAESHPLTARRISDQATLLMRHLGTREGFGEMFDEVFVRNLRNVIEAYRPVSTTHPEKLYERRPGSTWVSILKGAGYEFIPVKGCTGKGNIHTVACRAIASNKLRVDPHMI